MIYWWSHGFSWGINLGFEEAPFVVRYFKVSLFEDENDDSEPFEENTDTVRLCT